MKTCSRYSFDAHNNEISELLNIKAEVITHARTQTNTQTGTTEALICDYSEVMWEHVFLACQRCHFRRNDRLTGMACFAHTFCQTSTSYYTTVFCL